MDAKVKIWRPPQDMEVEPSLYFIVSQGDMVRLVSADSVCVNDVDGVPCVSFGNATNVIVTISDKGDYELAYNWNRSLLTIPLCKVEFLSQMRKPNSIGDLIRSNVNGWEGLQQELAEAFRRQLKQISVPAEVPARRICFELYSPGKIAGDASYLGDLVRAAGGKSIMPETGLISAEAVIEAAPDVIFYIEGFGSAAEIAARSAYSGTPAVRNGRIHAVPRRLTVEGIAPLEAIEFIRQYMR